MRETKKRTCPYFELIHLFVSLLIPVGIAVYAILENDRELSIAARNRAQDLEMADNRHKDGVLRDYQKSISKLIEKYGTEFNESSPVAVVARFATLSALNQIDPHHRNILIRLLYDAHLITYNLISDKPSISLVAANLVELCLVDGTEGQTLTHFSMAGAFMTGADFHGINIHGAIFDRAILKNADFSFSTNLWHCDDMDCTGPTSASIYFDDCDLTASSFVYVTYENVSFRSALMQSANLSSLNCEFCSFLLANLSSAILRRQDVKRTMFGLCSFEDTEIHQSSFTDADFGNTNMYHARVTFNNFTRCIFDSTNWPNTIFEHNIIVNSSFKHAKINHTFMSHNRFFGVDFSMAQITNSDWQNVRCEKCMFNSAVFNGTDLTNSMFIECDFTNATINKDQLKQISFP